MGEVIQLQGDQRKDLQEFLTSKDGLELKADTIKVGSSTLYYYSHLTPLRFTVSKPITNFLPCSGPLFPVHFAL